jgi:hypothetical protein
MGDSNHVLIMHHHNIMHSAIGGQNMTRFITPHAGTVFGPSYQTNPKEGRSSANGFVMAPLFITVPWDTHLGEALDASLACENSTDITANLTQHTNYSCLAAVDMGAVYGTQSICHGRTCVPSVNYAYWDGTSCITCAVAGNSSDWKFTPKPGTIGYVRRVKESDRSYRAMMKYDMNSDGVVDEGDMAASMVKADRELEQAQGSLEMLEARKKTEGDDDDEEEEEEEEKEEEEGAFNLEIVDLETKFEQDKAAAIGDSSGGGPVYILKSFNYGGGMSNWTYTLLPRAFACHHCTGVARWVLLYC